jgi:sRNA-binding regulator protein Hfq
MAILEDISHEYVEVSPKGEIPQIDNIPLLSDPEEVDQLISLNDPTSFSSLQTLKLTGYIKNMKFIILVDNGNSQNFIHRHLSQEFNFYIHSFKKFQILIANGGSKKCGGRCGNVHLQIDQYCLKYHMFTIYMGGCAIFLGDK